MSSPTLDHIFKNYKVCVKRFARLRSLKLEVYRVENFIFVTYEHLCSALHYVFPTLFLPLFSQPKDSSLGSIHLFTLIALHMKTQKLGMTPSTFEICPAVLLTIDQSYQSHHKGTVVCQRKALLLSHQPSHIKQLKPGICLHIMCV